MKTYDARWCSGITKDFESFDPGSNPGRAAFTQNRQKKAQVRKSPDDTFFNFLLPMPINHFCMIYF